MRDKVKLSDLFDMESVYGGGVIVLIILSIVIWLSLLFGVDPLNTQYNSYDNISVTYLSEDGETRDEMTFEDFVDLYVDKTDSLFKSKSNIDELRSSVASEFQEELKVKVIGKAEVVSLNKLNYNYELIVKLDARFRQVKQINIRVPFDESTDEFIRQLDKKDTIHFRGDFKSFTVYEGTMAHNDDGTVIINDATIIKLRETKLDEKATLFPFFSFFSYFGLFVLTGALLLQIRIIPRDFSIATRLALLNLSISTGGMTAFFSMTGKDLDKIEQEQRRLYGSENNGNDSKKRTKKKKAMKIKSLNEDTFKMLEAMLTNSISGEAKLKLKRKASKFVEHKYSRSNDRYCDCFTLTCIEDLYMTLMEEHPNPTKVASVVEKAFGSILQLEAMVYNDGHTLDIVLEQILELLEKLIQVLNTFSKEAEEYEQDQINTRNNMLKNSYKPKLEEITKVLETMTLENAIDEGAQDEKQS